MTPRADNGNVATTATTDAMAAEWFARRDAGLSETEACALQRWLDADPRHAVALARLEAAWVTFGKPVRAGAAEELLGELARRRTHRTRRQWQSVAVAAMIAVATGGVFWRGEWAGDASPRLPATATLRVPSQQVLPDGTRVTLNDSARIEVAFAAAERRVALAQGEAHFEVAKDPARPFVVMANGVAVKAVGTAFAVQVGATSVEVLVTEGTVAVDGGATPVSTPTQPAPESGVLVSAGNRVVVALAAPWPAAPQVSAVGARELDGRLAWRNPRVEFSGTALSEAIALLNREATGRGQATLVIADPQLAAMRVSGIFRTDNLDGFVLLLEAGFGVEAKRSGNTIELRKAR